MCGIGAVSLRHRKATADVLSGLRSINSVQAHRGPDGSGEWVADNGRVGLSHVRLAIVDLSDAAAQPMWSHDRRYVVSFNGEIYNWQELRGRLRTEGADFRTHSDTEVLLEGFRRWGYDILSKIRGMYAFCLYDALEETLLCARDPVGKKPLVYSVSDDGVLIASEIPGLLSLREHGFGIDTQVDHDFLASMLVHNLRHVPDPGTVYRGIRRLRPGHAITVRNGSIASHWRHWSPAAEPNITDYAASVREALEDSVVLRSKADVPVAALLSGGVDSTAIVALAQKSAAEPIRTYALGLNSDDEDLSRARLAAKNIGTDHKEFYFDPDQSWQRYRAILRAHGEPIALLPLVHSLTIAQAVRGDGIKVVLSGIGADELFYGYSGHLRTARVSRWMARAGWAARLVPKSLVRSAVLSAVSAAPGTRKAEWYRAQANATWARIVSDEVLSTLSCAVCEEMSGWGRLVDGMDYIDESNFVGLMVENAHSVATSADLPGMLASVEMRCPFLDSKMIDIALGVPWRQKLYDGTGQPRLKHVLKEAVADLVGASLLDAPKRGFGYEVQESRLFSGPWRSRVRDSVENLDDLNGFLDRSKVRRIWEEFQGGATQHAALLAKLLAIQTWRTQQ